MNAPAARYRALWQHLAVARLEEARWRRNLRLVRLRGGGRRRVHGALSAYAAADAEVGRVLAELEE